MARNKYPLTRKLLQWFAHNENDLVLAYILAQMDSLRRRQGIPSVWE